MSVDNKIRVVGRARRELVADRARWLVMLREDDEADAAAAFGRLAERREKLVDRLSSLGQDAEVETGGIEVREHGDYERVLPDEKQLSRIVELLESIADRGGQSTRLTAALDQLTHRRFVRRSFRAEANLEVELHPRDAAPLPELLVEHGVVHSRGPYFELEDRDDIIRELRVEAVRDARAQAEKLAAAADRKLGPALTISDQVEGFGLFADQGGGDPGAVAQAAAGSLRGRRQQLGASDEANAEKAPILVEVKPPKLELEAESTVFFPFRD